MTMSASTFNKSVVVGVVATFAMTLTGFWQDAVGLAELDVGALLASSMSGTHPEQPYSLAAGNLVHFANGVVLSLIWVAFLAPRIRGNWVLQGAVFTVLTTVAAAAIVLPAAVGVGVFFVNTPAPLWMLASDLVAHVAFGFTLTLGLKIAGVGASVEHRAPAFATALSRAA